MLEWRARFREFSRTPGYVLAIVASLSAGMAVCVAVFSIVNTLVFAETPGIAKRASLVRIGWSDGRLLTRADLAAFEAGKPPSFAAVAAQADRGIGVLLPSGAAMVPSAFVSTHFFSALGTRPIAGRLLTAADQEEGAPVLAISEALWRSAFGGTSETIGDSLIVGGHAFTIVGVTPQGFPGLGVADVGRPDSDLPQIFLPQRFASMWSDMAADSARRFSAAARLQDGARFAAARQEVAATGARLPHDAGGRGAAPGLRALRMGLDPWEAPGESAVVILLFLFVPLGVLAIGCVNVVNLQLARAVEQASELSVRLALGASGRRIAALLAAEVIPLAIVSGALGWAGARGLLAAAEALLPLRFALDGRALAFAAIVVCLTAAFGGLFPAWLTARDVVAAGLRARHGAASRTRLRHALVVGQVAASVALVAIAVLAARTLQSHAPVVPAAAASTLVAEFNLAEAIRANPARFVPSMLEALAGESNIRSAAFSDFSGTGRPIEYRFASDREDARRIAFGGAVTPAWFEATGTNWLAGRPPAARPSLAFEAAVNSAFATRAAVSPAAALGSLLHTRLYGADRPVEIVGIVDGGPLGADGLPLPMLILPMPAIPPARLTLTARADDVARARDTIAAAVKTIDPSVPFVRIETLDARLAGDVRGFRNMTVIASALAAIALLLASAGLYALMSYTVRRRTHEIGIRIALGAAPGDILTMILRVAMTLVGVGGLAGLAIAAPIAAVMRSAFYGLSPFSPSAGLPTVAVLLVVSAAAIAVPIYRAVSVDPLAALREL
jgi:predicted permease